MSNIPKPVLLVVAVVIIVIAGVLLMKGGGGGEPEVNRTGPPTNAMAIMKEQADKSKK